jgi:hypothetical protein
MGESLHSVGRHHSAVVKVVVRTPVEVVKDERQAELSGNGIEHLLAGWNHFLADAITCDHSYGETIHW